MWPNYILESTKCKMTPWTRRELMQSHCLISESVWETRGSEWITVYQQVFSGHFPAAAPDIFTRTLMTLVRFQHQDFISALIIFLKKYKSCCAYVFVFSDKNFLHFQNQPASHSFMIKNSHINLQNKLMLFQHYTLSEKANGSVFSLRSLNNWISCLIKKIRCWIMVNHLHTQRGLSSLWYQVGND